MLADMCCNDFPVLWIGMGEDVLNQIISILVACNVDQWNPRTVKASFTDSIEITTEEI